MSCRRVSSQQQLVVPELATLWRSLPEELVDKVLASMPVDILASCQLVCKDWNSRIRSDSFKRVYNSSEQRDDDPEWLLCSASANCRDSSAVVFIPSRSRWVSISLSFLPPYMRLPLASIGGLIFLNAGLSNLASLAVCNPFTRAWRELPPMNFKRFNPLVGVLKAGRKGCSEYKVVVAGGTSECGGDYQCSTEVYNSSSDSWEVVGGIPLSFTVKITVWASKTIFCKGVLYCLTSARPYNLMACHLASSVWSELKVPQPAHLFSSSLLQRKHKLLLVGGVGGDRVCERICIWELQQHHLQASQGHHLQALQQQSQQQWSEIERMPQAFFDVLHEERRGIEVKCAGSGDSIYFLTSSHSAILLCDLSTKPASWSWLPSCPLRSHSVKFAVRGLFITPRLEEQC